MRCAAVGEVTHYNVLEGLTQITENGAVQPLLAESWNTDPNGLACTFRLRQGVRFHDGSALNAAAVRFSFERAVAPGSTNKSRNALFDNIATVVTPDAHTVTLTLHHPDPHLLFRLGEGPAVILHPDTAAQAASAPVGTGPYRVQRWERGQRITLVKAESHHHAAQVRMERAVYRFLHDLEAQDNALRAGEIDVLFNFATQTVRRFQDNSHYQVLIGASGGKGMLALNHRSKPLDDVRVRRAITHAIDREGFIRTALDGRGVVIGSHFSPIDAGFAPGAHKIQVDIDPAEMQKPFVSIDDRIIADAGTFLTRLAALAPTAGFPSPRHREWLAWARGRGECYPAVLPRHREWSGKINPYHFMEELFAALADDDIVITGNATACIVAFQVARLRRGQRLISNSGSASMGYDLPASIGAAFAAPENARVICLAGDGSLQMNIQELQTLVQYQPSVKVLVLNNDGYLSIRTSQGNFFKRLVGEGPSNGVSFPDYCKVAHAYGLDSVRLQTPDFARGLREFLDRPGPGVCDVVLDEKQQFEPRMSSRQLDDGRIVTPPLEDMFPFLPREELAANVLRPD